MKTSPHAGPLQPRSISPDPSLPMAEALVKRAILHPNIFRKRVLRVSGNPRPGDWVAVRAEDEPANVKTAGNEREGDHYGSRQSEPRNGNQIFAYGIYNDRSEVALRLYRWWGDLPDDAFWDQLIDRAVELRRDVLKLDSHTNAYRVIHGESDGFPGLVVDRYADCLSAEVFSLGMYQRAPEILAKLAAKLGTQHWLVQPCPQFMQQEGFDAKSISSEQLPASVTIQEYGTKFKIHFGTGHKTGFFCDQRENRKMLADLCGGKTVLDLCCYSGGFSIQAAKLGQAAEVTGVDLDQDPLAMATKNANMNQVRVRFVQEDAFAFMRDMIRIKRQYDVVVLDPPKLIRTRTELEEGTHKHADLNRLAMQLVKPGGVMLTCSCAGLLLEETFFNIVRSAAKATGFDENGIPYPPRTVQIFSRHGAAADHPVVAHCPETEYLKSIWMRVI